MENQAANNEALIGGSGLNAGLGSTLEAITVALVSAGRGARFRQRKIFVCVRCDAIYADEPVTECDCETGAREFIEGIAEYIVPNAPHEGRTAALSPGVPLDAVVGPREER